MHLSPAALTHKGNAESACKSLITTGLFTRSKRGPLTFRSKARRGAMRSAAPDTRQHERENKFNGRKKKMLFPACCRCFDAGGPEPGPAWLALRQV